MDDIPAVGGGVAMNPPRSFAITDENFHNAYARAVRFVMRHGSKMVIGDETEKKPIRDACGMIEVTGDAISQIEHRELHPNFPFRHIDQYCDEFTYEYDEEYINLPASERFSYTYFNRLTWLMGRSVRFDQLVALRQGLYHQIDNKAPSNRNQAITWYPPIDAGAKSPPCLQRIWIRYLGDHEVEVHLLWRSRDLYTAWQANLIAIIGMLNDYVIHQHGCKIVKLIDFSDSFHIYESDAADAAQVNLVPVSPQTQRRG